jgi:HSP20 family molecular chaperone IbpA
MAFESDPFNELLRLQDRLASLLGAAPETRALGGWSSGVYPAIDIFRKQDAAVLRTELPGIRPEDLDMERIDAEFKNGVLTLTVPVAAAAKPRQVNVKAA